MSIRLNELTGWLDRLLDISGFTADSSNNGLQVEGTAEVNKAVFGVDATAALFAAAAERGADFIFTHHGISWGGNLKYLTGINASRVGILLRNNMSLYSVHLPLDAHPSHGHNALIADMAGLTARKKFFAYAGTDIGIAGELPRAESPESLAKRLAVGLDGGYDIYGDATTPIRTAAIVSGGGSDAAADAMSDGIECLVTGEVTHSTYHIVRESGLAVIVLGHYKSETPGVLRIMELVRREFGIDCEFIDQPTGM